MILFCHVLYSLFLVNLIVLDCRLYFIQKILECQDFNQNLLDNLYMNECLKALRVENGLTQQQLAEILNISNKNIWTYEKGIATPPPSVLVGYAKYFNVSLDYIFGLGDELGGSSSDYGALQLSTEERKLLENTCKNDY